VLTTSTDILNKGRRKVIYCGIDWAEAHHDVALVDESGTLVAKARISDDASGYRAVLELLAEHGDNPADPIPIAIETSRGLLVAALRTGTRKIFAINPMAAARYRDRHAVTRRKSDQLDALVLANILRTDMNAPAAAHRHRPGPRDRDPGPSSTRRPVEPAADRQPAALPAARVLSGRPGRRRQLARRTLPHRGSRTAQGRSHPGPGCAADPHPVARDPQARWAHT
jgi:hypothetical protein